MKGLVLVFSILLLVGCRSSKHSFEHNSDEAFAQQENNTLDIFKELIANIVQDVSESYSGTFNFQIYDTSLPVNSDTGKHPLKAEGEAKKEMNKQSGTTVNIKDSTNVHLKEESALEASKRENTAEVKEKEESTQIKQATKFIRVLMLFIIVVAIVVWYFKK